MIGKQVGSSNIISIGYDKKSVILGIEFKNRYYQHFRVLKEEYGDIMSDASRSSYFYRKIRNSYKQKKSMSNQNDN